MTEPLQSEVHPPAQFELQVSEANPHGLANECEDQIPETLSGESLSLQVAILPYLEA